MEESRVTLSWNGGEDFKCFEFSHYASRDTSRWPEHSVCKLPPSSLCGASLRLHPTKRLADSGVV
jgi:hypothetical protein